MGELVSLGEIETLVGAALREAGASAAQADPVARAVADAEAIGMRSHGVVYVPIYCEHLRARRILGDAVPVVTRPRAGTIIADAGCGFAHPAIEAGFEVLAGAAVESGIAALGVRNSYNCIVLGYHVEQLARQGLVAIGCANAPASIAPPGGKRALLGTNPMAMAFPFDGPETPLLFDQSISVVAKSEIRLRAREGESLPDGWAIDADGKPTNDPAAALAGSMLPAGGYKGFNWGLLVECLAGLLAGAVLAKDATAFVGTEGGPPRTGQFFIAIRPDAFRDADDHAAPAGVAAGMKGLVAAIEGDRGARVPGQRKHANRRRAQRDGVTIDAAMIDTLRRLASPASAAG